MVILLVLVIFIVYRYSTSPRMEGMPQNVLMEPTDKQAVLRPGIDSVTIIATKRFECDFIKVIFQGKNYRRAWATPIRVPTIDLANYQGGLKPLEKGGGMQTLSMDLQGPKGVVYTLRSINKNPEEIVPAAVRNLKIKNIVMDAMSAQHPYGALVVAALAEAAGIPHTHPKLFYLPSQEALGKFKEDFENKMFLLEYEPEGNGAWLPIENVTKIVDTEGVQKMMEEHPDSDIDERALVRARLFDLLIGDWDRHAEQWGWIVVGEEGQYTYLPLPTDRDNAFYNPGGIIPWLITRPFSQPFLRPFKEHIDYMPGLVRPFDQFFLLKTSPEVFREEALELQNDLRDEEIEQAFKVWPKAFYELDAQHLIKKIKARKVHLPKYAMDFKSVIDKRGPIKKPLKGSSKIFERN